MDIAEICLLFVTLITLYGNYLISEGRKLGFLIGLVCNAVLFTANVIDWTPSHALLFLVNALLSWNGWRRLSQTKASPSP